mmetsp:Transcript_18615/g.18709  ORF Transcript_18615/g.18709 Transcript_18615/m.18709 type:complete len:250 (+) Transcript_18615:154-903(+)
MWNEAYNLDRFADVTADDMALDRVPRAILGDQLFLADGNSLDLGTISGEGVQNEHVHEHENCSNTSILDSSIKNQPESEAYSKDLSKLERKRQRDRDRRKNMSEEAKSKERARSRARRKAMTEELKEIRRMKDKARRENMSDEAKELRRQRDKERREKRKLNMRNNMRFMEEWETSSEQSYSFSPNASNNIFPSQDYTSMSIPKEMSINNYIPHHAAYVVPQNSFGATNIYSEQSYWMPEDHESNRIFL